MTRELRQHVIQATADTGDALTLVSTGPGRTETLGALLGGLVRPGDLILLQGELGAGKTCLTRGVARGMGITPGMVKSPTFVFINEYPGAISLYHIDLYRVESIAEAEALGLEDYLGAKGVCIVEWAERGEALWPLEQLRVEMTIAGSRRRRLRFSARGKRHQALLVALREAAPSSEGRGAE